jgi:DNA-binding PadR family transcriptional regulator
MEDITLDNYEESMPHIVKSNKELLILSMIFEHPVSGYDLIKKIFFKTNVLLSQGTVYPILYSLEEADILQAEYGRGDMRTKIYHITPQGREIAQDKIDHFVQALSHFITLIDAEAIDPCSRHVNNDPALDLRLDLDSDKSNCDNIDRALSSQTEC